MLSKTSTDISVNYFKPLADNNIKLVPKQGSIIQDLSESILSNLYSKVTTTDIIPYVLETASTGMYSKDQEEVSYKASTHDSKMDNYIEELSTVLSNHTSFVRNVVNKELQEFVTKVKKRIDSYTIREIIDFFEIKYYKLPELVLGDVIRDELNDYEGDDPNKYFFTFINLSVIKHDDFDLLDRLKTGYEEEDKLIFNWYNEVGKEKIVKYLTEEISDFSLGIDSFIDYSLANYLFYRKLAIFADLDVSLTSVQLKSAAASNRDYFGKKTISGIKEYESAIRNGVLLTTDSEVNFSYYNENLLHLTILEESFNNLAEKGGTIDLILSYVANETNSDVTVDKLIKNKEDYINKWNTIKSLYYSYINSTKLDFYKTIFKESLDEHRTDAEKEIMSKDHTFNKETLDMQYDYINNLTFEDNIEDIEQVALHIIAKIRFRFTSAYYILSTMRSLMDERPEMTALEASLYASVNYITDYLMDQIDIVKI